MSKEDKIYVMETGELELRKAFEDVTTKNVKIVVDYSTQTRELVRDLSQELKELKQMLVTRDVELAQLKQQISVVQGQIYIRGTE